MYIQRVFRRLRRLWSLVRRLRSCYEDFGLATRTSVQGFTSMYSSNSLCLLPRIYHIIQWILHIKYNGYIIVYNGYIIFDTKSSYEGYITLNSNTSLCFIKQSLVKNFEVKKGASPWLTWRSIYGDAKTIPTKMWQKLSWKPYTVWAVRVKEWWTDG